MRLVLAVSLSALLGCATRPEERITERARELVEAGGSPRGNVVLLCEPADAEVKVDGIPRGLCGDFDGTPRGLTLSDGLHRIDVSRAGYVPYTTYYEPSGVKASFRITLRAVP